MKAEHVCVIGGGVIGLCSAHYLAERGHTVTVIDRGPARRDGCSFGNAGMVVPSHFIPLAAPGAVALGLRWMWNPESPFYVKPRPSWDLLTWGFRFLRASTARHVRRSAPVLRDMHLRSRRLFEELAADSRNGFGLTRLGLMMLCKTGHGFEEEVRAAAAAVRLGVPAEVLDPRQAAAREPDVRMDVAGAVHYPLDCHLSPAAFMVDLQDRLERRGVRFLWNAEPVGRRGGRRRIAAVATTAGEIAADRFVLACGSWSQQVGREFGLGLPMQAGKGYSLTLPRPRHRLRTCAILCEARVAVTPMGEALRVGGTMEIAGMDQGVNPRRVRGITRALPQYYPDFREEDFAGVTPWAGLRPVSPDGLPYIGRTARWENLIIAAGHAMMGLSLGPATGEAVAALVSGEKTVTDLTMLSPDRFG